MVKDSPYQLKSSDAHRLFNHQPTCMTSFFNLLTDNFRKRKSGQLKQNIVLLLTPADGRLR